jgi:hypothetical protein
MSARRDGEPSFTGVEGVADAIMAALSRGVDLVVPSELFNQNCDDLPRPSMTPMPASGLSARLAVELPRIA